MHGEGFSVRNPWDSNTGNRCPRLRASSQLESVPRLRASSEFWVQAPEFYVNIDISDRPFGFACARAPKMSIHI